MTDKTDTLRKTRSAGSSALPHMAPVPAGYIEVKAPTAPMLWTTIETFDLWDAGRLKYRATVEGDDHTGAVATIYRCTDDIHFTLIAHKTGATVAELKASIEDTVQALCKRGSAT